MSAVYHHPSQIFAKASALDEGGQSYALAVVTAVNGGAMRAPGALMLVGDDGQAFGYISNGCVDADIVMQALGSLKKGAPASLRYGEGSTFKDIKLPCGGSIDVMIVPRPNARDVKTLAIALIDERRAVQVSYSLQTGLTVSKVDGFTVTYQPALTVRIVGRGASVTALAQQSNSAGFSTIVSSNDPDITVSDHWEFTALVSPHNPPQTKDDAWTAVVLLFHDHDWEPAILRQALAGPAFYIGAMGSRRTHQARCEALSSLGVIQSDIDRIIGPIGLIPSLRDANLLALSILAQIVERAQILGRL